MKIASMDCRAEEERALLVAELRELVEALDRRVPRLERGGEQRIAAESAALKRKAEERIAELEAAIRTGHVDQR